MSEQEEYKDQNTRFLEPIPRGKKKKLEEEQQEMFEEIAKRTSGYFKLATTRLAAINSALHDIEFRIALYISGAALLIAVASLVVAVFKK